ncbi:hypothetical protein FACS1894163_04770 [Spirochaetia bacterium]|nr:hypothetical protein FACS1894163_04770 [Spirochaetia bacterium]
MMGSLLSEVGRHDEEVYRQVTVGDFYIGKYEVTQREYEALIGNNPSRIKGGNMIKTYWCQAPGLLGTHRKQKGRFWHFVI